MVNPFVMNVSKTLDKMGDLAEAIRYLHENEALVGIPQESSSGEGRDINNAELLYIHTNGSPVRGIPARPVIEPALENAHDEIAAQLQLAAKAAVDGGSSAISAVHKELGKAGQLGENKAKEWFTNTANGWPPIKDNTKKRRIDKIKGISDKKRGELTAKAQPLIDTGQLRDSITHVVRRRGENA